MDYLMFQTVSTHVLVLDTRMLKKGYYSMTQDSTSDTPQGGVMDNFFTPFSGGWEMLESLGV